LTQVIDANLIDQIVVEVLLQLRQRLDSARSSSNTKDPKGSIPTQTVKPIELPDAVITEETLKQQAKPGASIRVSAGAILTPTARDYIRSHRISLCPDERNGPAGSASDFGPGTIIASHLPEVVQSFIADVRKQSRTSWIVEMESGLQQVVDRVRSVICRGESKQALVFVKSPHKVACLVNRNPNCRAAVVESGEEVRRVRAEFGANVICVNLQQPTFIGLRDVLRTCGQTVDLAQESDGSET
jgi:hypothetical protein